jgi:hypothetical protein
VGCDPFRRIAGPALMVALSGCTANLSSPAGMAAGDDSPTESAPPPPTEPPVVQPPVAELKLKNGTQLRNDWAEALGLDPNQLCVELGEFDCVDDVHRVVLGGVEPYVLRVDRPLAEPALTTPLAVERVAWAGCQQAMERDRSGAPQLLVMRGAGLDRSASAAALVRALLRRESTENEVRRLAEHDPQLDDAAWADVACFAVATSIESLFY